MSRGCVHLLELTCLIKKELEGKQISIDRCEGRRIQRIEMK